MSHLSELKKPEFLVIPLAVIEDVILQPSDKFVYGAIYWFSKLRGEKCIASNPTIGKIVGLHRGSVANALTRLEERGYIKVHRIKDGVRSEIEPLVRFVKVSSDNDRVSSVDDRGVSSFDEQKKNTIKEEHVSIASLADRIVSKESQTATSNEVKELFTHYQEQFVKRIADKAPHFSWPICTRLAKPLLRKFGVARMKALLNVYLTSDDRIFKENVWSLSCFLSANTINKLNLNL